MLHRPFRAVTALAAAASTIIATVILAPGAAAAPTPNPTPAGSSAASSTGSTVTNLAHLNFLLGGFPLAPSTTHTTYAITSQPTAEMPWTYANLQSDGSYQRVGGGSLDPATGHWSQGAFNADDAARAAVVYVQHWQQFGDAASRQAAYQILRAVGYLQDASGPDAGNVVLWAQTDGSLSPDEPGDSPDPSDSADSFWLARTIWAFGVGYAAFRHSDPAFADFLRQRLDLATAAVARQDLVRNNQFVPSDGRSVPNWLINAGADATSEAVLGWSAYLAAAPTDRAVRTALTDELNAVADMNTPAGAWPYGATLQTITSISTWHAWGSLTGAALAAGAATLGERGYLAPALRETADFDPVLIAAGGPENAWLPTPIDPTEISYGVASRVLSLLGTADVTHRTGLDQLAALDAAWYFGANRAGTAMYDPATGITFDGLNADGSVNHNSGAESTIMALLAMMALDAHPAVKALARSLTTAPQLAGQITVEGESASPTTGTVVTPAAAWTGESQWSGGAYLELTAGQTATITIPGPTTARVLEPVIWRSATGPQASRWTVAGRTSTLHSVIGAQGVSPVSGALLPMQLPQLLPVGASTVTVTATAGTTDLDAILVRPLISTASFAAASGAGTQLLVSAATATVRQAVSTNRPELARSYDQTGRLVGVTVVRGRGSVPVAGGGFTVISPS